MMPIALVCGLAATLAVAGGAPAGVPAFPVAGWTATLIANYTAHGTLPLTYNPDTGIDTYNHTFTETPSVLHFDTPNRRMRIDTPSEGRSVFAVAVAGGGMNITLSENGCGVMWKLLPSVPFPSTVDELVWYVSERAIGEYEV